MNEQPNFVVRGLNRSVPVYGDAILSPMARYSDVPYRAVCRAFGSAMHYTEFVAADALLVEERNAQWRRLDKKAGESPAVFQIFGYDAHKLLAAAQKIEAWGPDIIDINMGCSVPKVSEQGAGVGMMLRPKLVADTFSLLTKHLTVPVTGKIRLGWDDEQINFLEIAHIMEDNGASLIAMHGRTKDQLYKGEANWDAIARLKQSVSVPVIGNGDIRTPDDIDAMKRHTGCDAVMIGRGAVGNPWIFSRRERSDLTFSDIADTVRLHLHEMVDYFGEPEGVKRYPRHLKRYFAGLGLKRLKVNLMHATTLAEFEEILAEGEKEVIERGWFNPQAALSKREPAPVGC